MAKRRSIDSGSFIWLAQSSLLPMRAMSGGWTLSLQQKVAKPYSTLSTLSPFQPTSLAVALGKRTLFLPLAIEW